MKTKLIVDSCCDLLPGLLQNMEVKRVSFIIELGDTRFVDNPQLNPLELLARMRASKSAVKTACPSPQEYLEEMRSAEACFVITISSRLSGSYNAAMTARSLALEETPDKKIHVFDSKSAASGETCVALRVQDCVDRGLSFEETVEDVSAYINSLRTHFVLKHLDNLIKNGRLGRCKGLIGMVLGIYPILGDNGDGEIVVLEKVRGLQQAMNRLVGAVRQRLKPPLQESRTLVISHCNCEERALSLKEQFQHIYRDMLKVIIVPTGGLSTAYADEGGIVIAY